MGEEYACIMEPLQGREQAAIDYKEVEHVVMAATHSNTYIKAANHREHIADFLGHLVAASFASPVLKAKTPAGPHGSLGAGRGEGKPSPWELGSG